MKDALGFLAVGVLTLLTVPQRATADAPAWMHMAASAPLPAYDSKTDAVLLYSEDIVTVTPDGKTKSIERRAYKILRPEGREYAFAAAYVGQDSKVGGMRAWCIPKQGKDYEVRDKEATERSLNVAGGELISDMKMRYLMIPAGDPGNVVGYEVQYDGRPYVLEDVWHFQREVPVKEARYTLQMPPGWEYKASWLNYSKVEPTAVGGNQWQWVLKDLAPLRPEAHMPPFTGVAGFMMVSFLAPGAHERNGFVTWSDMGKWEGGLVNGRREATPQVSQKVNDLTAGQTTPQQKMRSIAGFLQKDIRYVGVELGIGGFQPHTAGDVFAHRYGDCKDKATLLSAMLKQSGIESYYLVINNRRGAVKDDTPPMLEAFNHMILAIRLPEQTQDNRFQAVFTHPKLGRLLIFDPTNEKVPIGQLPGYEQGSFALLLTPDGGELIQTPELPTVSNGVVRTGKLTLEAKGTLHGELVETLNGDRAFYERYAQLAVQSSRDRVKRIEQEVAHSIGMFEITGATMSNLDATDRPFGYVYSIVAPGYAKLIGNLLTVRPRVMGNRSSDILETKEPRQFPVIFPGPEKDIDTFEITLPAGYEVDDLPPAVDVDYGFASYHSETKAAGDVLKYTRTFEIKELSVPLSRMEDLKKFYRIIAGDERNTAVLKPKA